MFDIGFMELVLVGVVALLVIGPERLPLVARKLGIWVGKMRRFISSVQTDFKAEVDKAEELKRLMEEQAKIASYHEILENSGEDEKGRVPVERLPHRAKSMGMDNESSSDGQVKPNPSLNAHSDAKTSHDAITTGVSDTSATTAVPTIKTRSVAIGDGASNAVRHSEEHDKA